MIRDRELNREQSRGLSRVSHDPKHDLSRRAWSSRALSLRALSRQELNRLGQKRRAPSRVMNLRVPSRQGPSRRDLNRHAPSLRVQSHRDRKHQGRNRRVLKHHDQSRHAQALNRRTRNQTSPCSRKNFHAKAQSLKPRLAKTNLISFPGLGFYFAPLREIFPKVRS